MKGREHCSCHIRHMDEVAALATVLEDSPRSRLSVKIDATPAYGVSRGILWP